MPKQIYNSTPCAQANIQQYPVCPNKYTSVHRVPKQKYGDQYLGFLHYTVCPCKDTTVNLVPKQRYNSTFVPKQRFVCQCRRFFTTAHRVPKARVWLPLPERFYNSTPCAQAEIGCQCWYFYNTSPCAYKKGYGCQRRRVFTTVHRVPKQGYGC